MQNVVFSTMVETHNKEDEDGEFTNSPGEATDSANGKTDLMSQAER